MVYRSFLVGWSLFPFVPTALIGDITGGIKMNFTKYIVAVALGEAVLIGIHIVLGIQWI